MALLHSLASAKRVLAAVGDGPVVLGDARPKCPHGHHGKEGKERLEEAAVDSAVGRVANVHADDVLEDLSNDEEESGSEEVDCEEGQLVTSVEQVPLHSHIGRFSPNTRNTKNISRTKKMTKNNMGTSWYSV